MNVKIPKEFEERMKNIIPNYDGFVLECEKNSIKGINVNINKISVSNFEKIFPYKIKKIPYSDNSFYLEDDIKFGIHPYHHAGLFYSQDPGACMPVNSIDFKDNYRVLDLCAAPGGKSIQIAQKLKNGFLVSNEYDKKRASILYSNIERMGLTNVIVTNSDVCKLKNVYHGYFDLVLIDAPCSGEGMFRKNYEAIKNFSVDNINLCVKRQKEILSEAAYMVKTDGFILYSTCTYEKEENEDMVDWFCKNYNYSIKKLNSKIDAYTVNGLEPVTDSRRFYPHTSKGEGQFMALLQNNNKIDMFIDKREIRCPNREENKIIDEFLQNLDIKLDVKILNNKIFIEAGDVPNNIHVISSGVQVGEIKNNFFLPNHYLFMAYGKYFKNKCDLDITDERVLKYLRGEEIEADVLNGYGVLMVNGYPLGGYKAVNGKLKNHYPKGLRNVC